MEYLTQFYNGTQVLFVENDETRLHDLLDNIRAKLLTDFPSQANILNAKLNEISDFITRQNPFIVTIHKIIYDILLELLSSKQDGGKKRRNLKGGLTFGDMIANFLGTLLLILIFILALITLVLVPEEERRLTLEAAAKDRARSAYIKSQPDATPGSDFYHRDIRRGGRKKSKQSKRRRTVKRR